MMQPYEIVGSFAEERYPSVDSQRTINMFEYIDPTGKRPKSLFSTSGLENANLNFFPETNGARTGFIFKDAAYQVMGASLFQITGTLGNLASTKIGSFVTSEGYVGVTANTNQIIFVDGQKGYIWNTVTESFSQITDTSFPVKPIDVTSLDGFFVVIQGESRQFQLSLLEEGLVWGPDSQTFTADSSSSSTNWLIVSSTANYQTGVPFTLSTTGTLPAPLTNTDIYYAIQVDSTHIRVAASKDDAYNNNPITLTTNGTPTNTIKSLGQDQTGLVTSYPGTLVACETLHRRIFFFSQNFTEVWENAGIGTNLPFRRNNSLLMELGTPAIGSVKVGFDRLFFLSQNKDGIGSVMEVEGTTPIPVSTHALDYQINQFAEDQTLGETHVSDATGLILKENGIIFYRLNFTKANQTYVYNLTMSRPGDRKWHEEELLNGDRHPAQTHIYFQGNNYYGAYNSATLYRVDSNITTNDGEAIRRVRIGRQYTPPSYARMRIDRWLLDVIQGTPVNPIDVYDNLATQGAEPIVTEQNDNIVLEQKEFIQIPFPKIFLSVSKDGGQSYGYKQTGNMGKIGERTVRTMWRKLGVTPDGQGFVPKIEFFYDVPFVILGAGWDMSVLPD